MGVTVVSRWTTPNVEASTAIAKRAKALWLKNGAQDFRLSQIYSGQYTGQWLVATLFEDMTAFGKSAAAMSSNADMQQIQQENAKLGAVMLERWILVGTDL
jgi:hypothetical protein